MNVERDYGKAVAQYEEDDAETRVYKLARVPAGEAGWSPQGDGAFFRALGGRVQWFRLEERASEEVREELETFLRSLPPLLWELIEAGEVKTSGNARGTRYAAGSVILDFS